MPSLGADMEAGKLIEWLVKPGDRVAKGDIVAVVETQKGAIEIEIFEPGVINALLAAPGQTLPVGAALAQLGETEGGAPATAVASQRETPTAAEPPAIFVAGEPIAKPVAAALPVGGAPLLASPAARVRASELALPLGTVQGSGPGGAVLLADVERADEARRAPSEPRKDDSARGKPGLDMAEMRRAIAAAMSRAKREIPHYYLCHEIDLQPAQDWLTMRNAVRIPDERLLMGALLIRATVKALAKVPEFNGRFEADPYTPSAAIHCGVAVAMRGGGLIAPAILDAQDMDLNSIMAAIRDMVGRARIGRLRNSEITQGTITISSLGETGVDALVGVIYPPQVALVGFGAPRLKPMVSAGTVLPRIAITISLAADHRISDGRRGALFLSEIERLLQEPESL